MRDVLIGGKIIKKPMDAFSNDITDMDLQALVDNALSAEERALLLDRIQKFPDARERLEELLHQKESIKAWWKSKPIN